MPEPQALNNPKAQKSELGCFQNAGHYRVLEITERITRSRLSRHEPFAGVQSKSRKAPRGAFGRGLRSLASVGVWFIG